ncbi:HAD family hydrolase [Cutibacterium avidum]|uniref:HAD family hydrolase n=1 Tax=Cutibacterium avidum TaxID=33010 RepID=UPI0020938660|nr:HAD family hydrolase [Cutibacterium avidum]MCO6679213.1 HAD family hydrolase [Cutibacterium avidum]
MNGPLIMVDLDNTLVDRQAAIRRWARSFTEEHGGSVEDVEWLIAVDGDGGTARETLAAAGIQRFGSSRSCSDVALELRTGIVERSDLFPGAVEGLREMRELGCVVVCVTNGSILGQRATLQATGLAEEFDSVIISEAVGLRKPDPGIFYRAADSVLAPLNWSWMVGDSPMADVLGAAALGCRTAWIRRGRTWAAELRAPDMTIDRAAEGFSQILRLDGMAY